jgi:hypothetical protein
VEIFSVFHSQVSSDCPNHSVKCAGDGKTTLTRDKKTNTPAEGGAAISRLQRSETYRLRGKRAGEKKA